MGNALFFAERQLELKEEEVKTLRKTIEVLREELDASTSIISKLSKDIEALALEKGLKRGKQKKVNQED